MWCRGGCQTGLCPARFPAPPSAGLWLPGAPLSRHLLQPVLGEFAGSQLAGLSSWGASFVQEQGRVCWAPPCSESPGHTRRFHALFPVFPWLAGSGAELCASRGGEERIPGACSELPAPPSLLRSLWHRELAQLSHREPSSRARVPAAAGLNVPSAGEMLGQGWLCCPELLWRADKLPANCSSLESIQRDGG